jgi:asparagine synthase (glutamine-hydrolysing)
MSGIVGIVNLDRAPVDRGLLERMTEFLRCRGPDAQAVWSDGHVGFGHTLLKTTDQSEYEYQPFTLDRRVWIVADARVDARRDLIASLHSKGHEDLTADVTDVELIARAYHVWGEQCVEHLLGDFAFAVWDSLRKTLFLGRDHLGVKPLFYAHVGESIIFSNTLECIRHHPDVSKKLNDLAIADFLLFGVNQELDTTCFAEIRRLPPAHSASWSKARPMIRRFWTMAVDEPQYFSHPDDYTERFKELVRAAVSDRLRTDRVGVFMSGGLDSTTLAFTAVEVMRNRSALSAPIAFTTILDGIVDNNESVFAAMVAKKLQIPVYYHRMKFGDSNGNLESSSTYTPEPVSNPLTLQWERMQFNWISSQARMCLYGEGADNALAYEWRPHLSYLIAQRRLLRLVRDLVFHVLAHRRIPLLPTVFHGMRKKTSVVGLTPHYPTWLEKSFESRLDLRARWNRYVNNVIDSSVHPVRPKAYESFTGPLWAPLFEGFDAANTSAPLVVSHPYVDVRLLRYLLSVPALPWCRSKYLLRRAMRGALPAAVLQRPKSPLTSDPAWEWARGAPLPPVIPSPGLATYVRTDLVSNAWQSPRLFRANLRVRSLSQWLNNLEAQANSKKRRAC